MITYYSVFLILATVATGVRCQYLLKKYAPDHDNYETYSYAYGVSDPISGDHKHQWERMEHGTVRGEYGFMEPDGLMRLVQYTAGPKQGFQATVSKIAVQVARSGYTQDRDLYQQGEHTGARYASNLGPKQNKEANLRNTQPEYIELDYRQQTNQQNKIDTDYANEESQQHSTIIKAPTINRDNTVYRRKKDQSSNSNRRKQIVKKNIDSEMHALEAGFSGGMDYITNFNLNPVNIEHLNIPDGEKKILHGLSSALAQPIINHQFLQTPFVLPQIHNPVLLKFQKDIDSSQMHGYQIIPHSGPVSLQQQFEPQKIQVQKEQYALPLIQSRPPIQPIHKDHQGIGSSYDDRRLQKALDLIHSQPEIKTRLEQLRDQHNIPQEQPEIQQKYQQEPRIVNGNYQHEHTDNQSQNVPQGYSDNSDQLYIKNHEVYSGQNDGTHSQVQNVPQGYQKVHSVQNDYANSQVESVPQTNPDYKQQYVQTQENGDTYSQAQNIPQGYQEYVENQEAYSGQNDYPSSQLQIISQAKPDYNQQYVQNVEVHSGQNDAHSQVQNVQQGYQEYVQNQDVQSNQNYNFNSQQQYVQNNKVQSGQNVPQELPKINGNKNYGSYQQSHPEINYEKTNLSSQNNYPVILVDPKAKLGLPFYPSSQQIHKTPGQEYNYEDIPLFGPNLEGKRYNTENQTAEQKAEERQYLLGLNPGPLFPPPQGFTQETIWQAGDPDADPEPEILVRQLNETCAYIQFNETTPGNEDGRPNIWQAGDYSAQNQEEELIRSVNITCENYTADAMANFSTGYTVADYCWQCVKNDESDYENQEQIGNNEQQIVYIQNDQYNKESQYYYDPKYGPNLEGKRYNNENQTQEDKERERQYLLGLSPAFPSEESGSHQTYKENNKEDDQFYQQIGNLHNYNQNIQRGENYYAQEQEPMRVVIYPNFGYKNDPQNEQNKRSTKRQNQKRENAPDTRRT